MSASASPSASALRSTAATRRPSSLARWIARRWCRPAPTKRTVFTGAAMLRADVVGLLPERRSRAARGAPADRAAGRGRDRRRRRRPRRPASPRARVVARRPALGLSLRRPARARLPVVARADERRMGLPDRRRRGTVGGAPRPALGAARRRGACLHPAALVVARRLARPVPVAAGLATASDAARRDVL